MFPVFPLTSLFLTPPATAKDEEQDRTSLGVGKSMGLPLPSSPGMKKRQAEKDRRVKRWAETGRNAAGALAGPAQP